MNRLAVAFAVICLLQGLSAVPRPEYGLAVEIKNSAKISDTITAVNPIIAAITGITITAPTSGFTKFTDLKTQIEAVISSVNTYYGPITAGYEALVENESGDIEAAFASFIEAISNAAAYIASAEAGEIISAIDDLAYEDVSDQLEDAFGRILNGLNALRSAAESVQDGIMDALDANGEDPDVPADVLRANLPVQLMYAFVKAANDLKAYLPLVEYILTTVKENIETADTYIEDLIEAFEEESESISEELTSGIVEVTTEIKNELTLEFGDILSAYTSVLSAVDELGQVSGATNYAALATTLSAFQSAFQGATLSTKDASLSTAFDDIVTSLEELTGTLLESVDVLSSDLVGLLVDTLIGNLEYGRYCYNKYKDVVTNIITQGVESGLECVDKEIVRLLYLQDTLLLIIELLEFDYESIAAEVTVCNSVASNSANLNNCVNALNIYYTALLAATEAKRDLIYTLAETEAAASENRLLICQQITYIELSAGQIGEVIEMLNICAAQGPNGSD